MNQYLQTIEKFGNKLRKQTKGKENRVIFLDRKHLFKFYFGFRLTVLSGGNLVKIRIIRPCNLLRRVNWHNPNTNLLVWFHRYWLVWVGHHGNQHVEQHDDVAHWVAPEHQQRPEPCKILDPRELKISEVHQSKNCPEKWLNCLKQIWKSSPNQTSCVFCFWLYNVALLFF